MGFIIATFFPIIWAIIYSIILILFNGIRNHDIKENIDGTEEQGTFKNLYSVKEMVAIEKFRTSIINIPVEDNYYKKDSVLIRVLRARNFNLQASYNMFQKSMKWRIDNRIESIVGENILNLSSPAYNYDAVDMEGRPVIFITWTQFDIRKLILAGQRQNVSRYMVQMIQRGYHKLRNTTRLMSDGEEVTQIIAIIDFFGFNVKQHLCIQCVGVFTNLIQTYEDNFPDSVKYAVLVNVNRLAMPLIDIARSFISTTTEKALKVFGVDKSTWGKFLRSIIPSDQLIPRFGGTKKNRK